MRACSSLSPAASRLVALVVASSYEMGLFLPTVLGPARLIRCAVLLQPHCRLLPSFPSVAPARAVQCPGDARDHNIVVEAR